ncbi:hypothetical protein MSPP1_003781 [Malassezia sp. CBS 17886]|nr:hypothetical protein MSPP1_003781 [Malassezia sp. CBS 17886]
MARGHLVREDAAALIEPLLRAHDRETNGDAHAGGRDGAAPGATSPAAESSHRAVDYALLLHNVCAASRVYSSLPLERLAELVCEPPHVCEALVGRMIVDGLLPHGSWVDQAARAVHFACYDDGGDMAPPAGAHSDEDAEDAAHAHRTHAPAPPSPSELAQKKRMHASMQYLEAAHTRMAQ